MANVIVNDESLKAIGNSIRGKNGESVLYTPAEMPGAINLLSKNFNYASIIMTDNLSKTLDFSNYIKEGSEYYVFYSATEIDSDYYQEGFLPCFYSSKDSGKDTPIHVLYTIKSRPDGFAKFELSYEDSKNFVIKYNQGVLTIKETGSGDIPVILGRQACIYYR